MQVYSCKVMWLTAMLFVICVFPSCTKDGDKLTSGGEITLSSEKFGTQFYYSMGYSFETQEFNKTNGSGTAIDIYLNEIIKPSGGVTGVQFATSSLSESDYGFYLNSGFTSPEPAKAYYNAYIKADVPGSAFVALTDTVKPYQVYTFLTHSDHYVKILVKEIRTVQKDGLDHHMDVDIEYFIQRDGTDKLSD
jgi:hypothetical protein